MARAREPDRPPLLLIGELREELGTSRIRIAIPITKSVFRRDIVDAMPRKSPQIAQTRLERWSGDVYIMPMIGIGPLSG